MMDILQFQIKYELKNRDMARICSVSLPTIQKWRSGEIRVSGVAMRLLQLLDREAAGDPLRLNDILNDFESKDKAGEEDDAFEEPKAEEVLAVGAQASQLDMMLAIRRLEKALKESEARYESIMESSQDAICRWLKDTTLTYANGSYRKIFQKGSQDITGRRWLTFIPREEQLEISTLVAQISRTGETLEKEHRSYDKAGKLVVQRWNDYPILNEAGDVVEFHSIGRDLSPVERLREERDYLLAIESALLQRVERPLVIFDENGSILATNPVFQEMWPQVRSESNLFDFIKDRPSSRFRRLLKRMKDGERMIYRYHTEADVHLFNIDLVNVAGPHRRYLAEVQLEVKGSAEQEIMRVRIKHETFLINKKLISAPEPETSARLKGLLKQVGENLQVDRLSLFIHDKEHAEYNCFAEWCGEAMRSYLEVLQGVSVDAYAWWKDRIERGQPVTIDDVQEMPRSAQPEKEILTAQGIRTIAAVPLYAGQEIIGFLAAEQLARPRMWHEQDIERLSECEQALRPVLAQMT